LEAAEEIILRDGYRSAKIADIAKTTGVSVGTLYNYFDSKQAVLDALLEYYSSCFVAHVEQPFDADEPLKQLRQLVARACEFAGQNEALFKLYVLAYTPGIDSSSDAHQLVIPSVQDQWLRSNIEKLLRLAADESRVRSDIPMASLVWVLKGLLLSLFADWCQRPDSVSLKQQADELVSLFLQGACPR
jgi:AcrR family transcriptional regulator